MQIFTLPPLRISPPIQYFHTMIEVLFINITTTNVISALLKFNVPSYRQDTMRNMEHPISWYIVDSRTTEPCLIHVIAACPYPIHLGISVLEPFLVVCFFFV